MQPSIENAIRLYKALADMAEFDAFGGGLVPAAYWAVNQPEMQLSGTIKMLPVKPIIEMNEDELRGYRQGFGCVEVVVSVEFGGCDHEQNPLAAPRISVNIYDRRKGGMSASPYCASVGQYAPSERGWGEPPVELTGVEQIAAVLRQLVCDEQAGS